MTIEPEFLNKEKYGVALEFFVQQLQTALKNETFLSNLTMSKIDFLHHILFKVKGDCAVEAELTLLSSLKAGLETFSQVQVELESGVMHHNPFSLSARFYEHLESPYFLVSAANSVAVTLRYLTHYLQSRYRAIIEAPNIVMALQENCALFNTRLLTLTIAESAEQPERATLQTALQAFKTLVRQEALCRSTLEELSDKTTIDCSQLTTEGLNYFWLPALQKMLTDQGTLSWALVNVVAQLANSLEGDIKTRLMAMQEDMETYLRASSIKPKATLAQEIAELAATLTGLIDEDANAYLKQLAARFKEASVSAADHTALLALKQSYAVALTDMSLYRGQKNESRFKHHVMFAQHFLTEAEKRHIVALMLLQARAFHEKLDALIYLADCLGNAEQQAQALSLQKNTQGGRLAHELASIIAYIKKQLSAYFSSVKDIKIRLQLNLVLEKLEELHIIFSFVNDPVQEVGFSERYYLNKTILEALLKLSKSATDLLNKSGSFKSYAELLATVSAPLFRTARELTSARSVSTSSVSVSSESSEEDTFDDERGTHLLRAANTAAMAIAPTLAFWQSPKEGLAINPLLAPYQRLCENAGITATPAKKGWFS